MLEDKLTSQGIHQLGRHIVHFPHAFGGKFTHDDSVIFKERKRRYSVSK